MRLNWLPEREDWEERLRAAKELPASAVAGALRTLATSRMPFVQMGKLDRVLQRELAANGGAVQGLERVRLAVLGSATTSHLAPGIRVAGLRRGLAIEVYESPYGMYRQELIDEASGLHAFAPEVILLALDARHLVGGDAATAETAMATMRSCWHLARTKFDCQILQQTVLPVFSPLLGNNEERLRCSPAAMVSALNTVLRAEADEESVDLLAIDALSARDGLGKWYDAGMWHRSKHEVHPQASECYGEQVARLVAAGRGMSAKCLVLDLDNTLWGGTVGDDGLEGIVVGQGSGTGEAFAEFQRYVKGLSERGVLLAICSKNAEENALEPFLKHPEMVLRCEDVVCFMANWNDKATNLRQIAKTLNIGLDSLVFVDDNPSERELIRRELPMVAVPEMPDDPAAFVQTLAAAGYFEGLRLTEEDLQRGQHYQTNAERERLKDGTTDMEGYLQSLRMVMTVQPFETVGLARVTQLINKTNQFNVMTERLCEAEVAARMKSSKYITMQVRLADRFGDNGVIAVLIARMQGDEAVIESWLMSCRVLGRRVEEACLNALAERCADVGVTRLAGRYRASEKNGMVKELYARLGFVAKGEVDGVSRWELGLKGFVPSDVPIQVESLREAVV